MTEKSQKRIAELGRIKGLFSAGKIPSGADFGALMDWADEGIRDAFTEGMIMMFSGDTPPDGWYLCNAEGHQRNRRIPDLSDKFIVGSDRLGTSLSYGDKLTNTGHYNAKSFKLSLDNIEVASSNAEIKETYLSKSDLPEHNHFLNLPFRGYHLSEDEYHRNDKSFDKFSRTNAAKAERREKVNVDLTIDPDSWARKYVHITRRRQLAYGEHSDNRFDHRYFASDDGLLTGGIPVESSGVSKDSHSFNHEGSNPLSAHKHDFTLNSFVVKAPVDVKPPYYALAFIIRLDL